MTYNINHQPRQKDQGVHESLGRQKLVCFLVARTCGVFPKQTRLGLTQRTFRSPPSVDVALTTSAFPQPNRTFRPTS